MDVVTLSRIQFALTSGFHYIYPPLSIGLGLFLVILEGIYIKTKNPAYKRMTKFWVKIFALTFALGVATGLVQVFGFGTNWSRYSRFVGDVFGSALAAEGVFAFFLEAGFLGIMLFGWDRVRPSIHYLSTILVALGAHFSAVWIVVTNSWMQTPAGFTVVGEGESARAVVTNFWEMVFNPSSIDRLVHVILGCWLAGIFLVLSVSAYYYLKKKHLEFANSCMKIGLILGMITLVLQLISADSTARLVAKHQPVKLAAMEGIFDTTPATPIAVAGIVDMEKEEVKGIQIPGLLSLLTYRNWDQPVPGLKEFPREEWPNVQVVFQAYHLMVAMWGLMFLVVSLACFYFWKKKLSSAKWLLFLLVLSVTFPQIANQVGWMTAEVGRQPWIVYGVLRTAEGVSPNIFSDQVLLSISMFILVYLLLFALFIYILNHKIQTGPDRVDDPDLDPVYRDPYESSKEGETK